MATDLDREFAAWLVARCRDAERGQPWVFDEAAVEPDAGEIMCCPEMFLNGGIGRE